MAQRRTAVVGSKTLKSLLSCAGAAFLAPLICLLFLLCLELVSGGLSRGAAVMFFPALVIQCCLALALLILFWMPAEALMQNLHRTGLFDHACGGCLFGLVLALLVDHTFQVEEQQGIGPGVWSLQNLNWEFLAYSFALGGLCSSLAWMIRRPDKD